MSMNSPEGVLSRDRQAPWHYGLQWGPAVAGALTAAAIGFVLDSFGAAIGLALSSTAPTWRDSSLMLQLLSGLYLVLVAITAFGVGGYIAGRLRTPIDGSEDDVEFRDGSNGLLVWAIAMVLTVLMVTAAALSLPRAAASSVGSAGAAQSIAGEKSGRFRLGPTVPRGAPSTNKPGLCALGGGPNSSYKFEPFRRFARRPGLSDPAHCS